jgi:hypothetical protein
MNKLSYTKCAKVDNAHAPTPIFVKKLWFNARLPALVLLKMIWLHIYSYSWVEIFYLLCLIWARIGLICVFFTDPRMITSGFVAQDFRGREDKKPSTVRLNPYLGESPHTSRARSDQTQLIKSSWLFIFDAWSAPIFLALLLVGSCCSREHHSLWSRHLGCSQSGGSLWLPYDGVCEFSLIINEVMNFWTFQTSVNKCIQRFSRDPAILTLTWLNRLVNTKYLMSVSVEYWFVLFQLFIQQMYSLLICISSSIQYAWSSQW